MKKFNPFLVFDKFMDKILPLKAPDFTQTHAESLSQILPYENFINDNGRDIFVLNDGALGVMWELSPIAHEILSLSDLERLVANYASVFDVVISDRVCIQVIYNSKPSSDFIKPEWHHAPQSFSQKVVSKRIEMVEQLATVSHDKPLLKKTKIYFSLRIEPKNKFDESQDVFNDTRAFEKAAKNVQDTLVELQEKISLIENHFSIRNIGFKALSSAELVLYLREKFHDLSDVKNTFFTKNMEISKNDRIANNLVNGSIEWSPNAVAVGNDLIEVISWSSQPNVEYSGMMTELLKVKTPLECVVNIRPVNDIGDLASLANQLNSGGDSARERQKKEVAETEDRIVYGEKLLSVSFHLMYRNCNLSILDDHDLRGGSVFAKSLTNSIMPVFVEKYAAFPVFMACLPLCYSRSVSGFLARERRTLSKTIGSYLPIFAGSQSKKAEGQLMISRNGEACWYSSRQSPTNMHMTLLGGSGSGKSVYTTNYITSEFAFHDDLMVFIIDSITSYKYLAKVIGEEKGSKFIKPPQEFPNIFKGEINKARMPIIMLVLKTAVNLVTGDHLTATEETILASAILKTYNDNLLFSKTDYIASHDPKNLGSYEDRSGEISVPRLSQIVDAFNVICDQEKLSPDIGVNLRAKLLPFFKSGSYAIIFDRVEYQDENERSPGITLYDLEDIGSDPVLTTLTSILIVSEISRLINSPANKGRFGCLIVDEAGKNLKGNSEELVRFIEEAFVTFRKKDIACCLIANEPKHYEDLIALKTARSIAANEIILKQEDKSIKTAQNMYGGKGMLTNEYDYELVGSLTKKKGVYAELYYISDHFKSTMTNILTGCDYWLAISKGIDAFNFDSLEEKGFRATDTLWILAEEYPTGVCDSDGELRRLSSAELDELAEKYASLRIKRQGASSGAHTSKRKEEIKEQLL